MLVRNGAAGFVFHSVACAVFSFLNAVFLSNSAHSYGFCVNTSGKSDVSRFTVSIVESECNFLQTRPEPRHTTADYNSRYYESFTHL